MKQQPSSRAVLRRLLILLAAAAVLVIFSYGWTVTDIDLSVPQQPQRQENVGNALRQLLSPNVFTQEYEIRVATASFLIGCPDGFAAPEVASSDTLTIAVEPACGSSGDIVIVSGYNLHPNSLSRLNWIATDGERRIRQVEGQDNFVTRPDGSFSVEVEVPRIRGTRGETHTIEVQNRYPVGLPTLSNTTGLVLEKMVETIFLALIATTISILPAAILSFLAAHNLMKPVRTQLGALLVSFALLPVGWLLGALLLGPVGALALSLGKGGPAAGTAAALVFAVGAVASTRRLRESGISAPGLTLRGLGGKLLTAALAVAALGLLGGVGILIGKTFTGGIPGHLGGFIGSLGSLIDLIMPLIAGVVGAYTLSTIGAALSRGALKRASGALNHALGAVLGGLSGAILLGAAAAVGMLAAWLGLLAPVAAGGLAGAVLPQLYRRFSPRPVEPNVTDHAIVTALRWLGAALGFVATFSVLNVGRALIEGTLPSQHVTAAPLGLPLYDYVAAAMLIGAALGAAAGGLSGVRVNFPIGTVLYSFTRTVLNALRSIEPLIMGLVFVIWVGIGPFAGVLALALHSIASLGKLYSEQIESIDNGPIEALESTGANRIQTIMYAVVPQIIPPYIAFTMYRWDINVRMSTIIGFVGGGGIGFLLQQQINLLRYRDAGVAVLAIAIVVSILDYASAAIRERYV